MDAKDLYDEIARAAYELFEKCGYTHGDDLGHWFEAEKIVTMRYVEIKTDEDSLKPAKKAVKRVAKKPAKKAEATPKKTVKKTVKSTKKK